MYCANKTISLSFIYLLVYVILDSSAEYLNSTKQTTLTNDFCPVIVEDSFYSFGGSGEVQSSFVSSDTSIKHKLRILDNIDLNANNASIWEACSGDVAAGYLNSTKQTTLTNHFCSAGSFYWYGDSVKWNEDRVPTGMDSVEHHHQFSFSFFNEVGKVFPSTEDGIYMIVPNHDQNDGIQKDMWIFVKAISIGVWIEMGIVSIIVGVVIKYMEYRVDNAQFSGPLLTQFFMLLWFPLSVLVFREGHIANKWSKGVIFIWLCTTFLVIQCYFANLSSLVTDYHPQQLLPREDSYIGYRDVSIKQTLIEHFGFDESNLKQYSTIKEYHTALSRGSSQEGVSAIFDWSFPLDDFIHSYGSKYVKIGPIRKAIGFGYAFFSGTHYHFKFPIKSKDVDENLLVKEVRMQSYKYHSNEEPRVFSQTRSLGAYNFSGILILSGALIVLVILLSEISIWRESITILDSVSVEVSVHSASEMIEVHEDLNTFETRENTSSSSASGPDEEELAQEE